MNKQTMIKNYRELSGADSELVGFIYDHKVYALELKHIPPRMLTVQRESQKNGGALALRFEPKKKHKEQMIKKGALCLGNEEMLDDNEYNKGEIFEKIITECLGQKWEKDNKAFDKGGDVTFRGREIQIKFQRASITNERALKNARKRAKANK